MNRPLSHGDHFESKENKKLCFCTSSLALDDRLDVQHLLFHHCVIKVYCANLGEGCRRRDFPGDTNNMHCLTSIKFLN